MAWWGKLIGGAFGYMLGGPLGAVLGTALGHKFDQGLTVNHGKGRFEAGPDHIEITQTAFFTATFSVMGHIAKADGQVTLDEIRFTERIMQHMNLTSEQRKLATNLFREGKKPDFPLNEVLYQFHRHVGRHKRNLLRMFIEIQVQAAYGDGRLHTAEEQVLIYICHQLGISTEELRSIEFMIRASAHFDDTQHDWRSSYQRRHREQAHPRASASLDDAYAILGISKEATDREVTKAYRRMMSRHHPDKLASQGLPEEMMKAATEKTQQIKKAYEMIRKKRKHK